MESKVVEIGGQFKVRVRDRNRGGWADDKAFPTVAEALARETELKLQEQAEQSGERVNKREIKDQAEATVNKAAAEQAQDQAEARAERVAELAGREPPEFKHEQPKGARRR